MKRNHKIMIAGLAIVAILIGGVATTALAAPKASVPQVATAVSAEPRITTAVTATPTEADYQAWGCPIANGGYGAIADLLGMTPQEIYAQLQQGKSLVEIAAGKGVTEDKLVTAVIAPMKEFMQQQVTAGTWTQAQADTRLQLAEQHIRQIINVKGGVNVGGCGRGWGYSDNTTGNGPSTPPGGRGWGGMMRGNWGSNSGNTAPGQTSPAGRGWGGMMGGWGGSGRGGMMGW